MIRRPPSSPLFPYPPLSRPHRAAGGGISRFLAASAAFCRLMPPMTPEVRRAHVTRARDLFNAGEYWLAHEALETVWRSIISDGDAAAARVLEGLIQAAAALLLQQRGNSLGGTTV